MHHVVRSLCAVLGPQVQSLNPVINPKPTEPLNSGYQPTSIHNAVPIVKSCIYLVSLLITGQNMRHFESAYQCGNNQVVVPCKDRILDLSSIKAKQNSDNREQGQHRCQRVHLARRFSHNEENRRLVVKARMQCERTGEEEGYFDKREGMTLGNWS